MLAFDLLRVGFANGMRSRGEMPFIDSGSIGIKVQQPKRREQLLQFHKYRIGSTAKRLRQDHATHNGQWHATTSVEGLCSRPNSTFHPPPRPPRAALRPCSRPDNSLPLRWC